MYTETTLNYVRSSKNQIHIDIMKITDSSSETIRRWVRQEKKGEKTDLQYFLIFRRIYMYFREKDKDNFQEEKYFESTAIEFINYLKN